MIAFHKPVLTQQKVAPWSWLILINLAWFAMMYSLFVTSVGLPLTLLKFTDDTRLIAFVTSVGGIMGIVIGPVCNYISDRLWTHWGRRRPFLLVAMSGTFTAMILTPFMPSLVPLVLLVVVSSLLGDVGSTFEPLWLEVIPPDQRGRGFVMRSVMIQLASVYFFQVMFAQWDNFYSFDLSGIGLGSVDATGEQLTYFAAAFLQAYIIIFLVFLVREVHPEGVELKPWSQLNFRPLTFVKDFFTDVFGEKRWWPIYLFYIAPGILAAGGGTFGNLMMVDQWKYEKSAIALMGFPPMVMGILIAAPLLGRQSDRFHRYPLWGLLGVIAATGAATWWVIATTFPALGPMDLPPLWAMFAICTGCTGVGIATVFLVTQTLNAISPHQNPRLWPWLLGPVTVLVFGLLGLYYVRVHLGNAAPPISHWFFWMQISSCFGGFTALAGPLLYEYMPGDKIGTLSSGFGLLSTAIGALMANVMGFWIFYFTKMFGSSATGTQDYSSSMYSILLTAPLAFGLMIYFFRLASKGRLIEYGRLKLNSDGKPIEAGVPAEH